ncbi:unnamed protein product [Allacma fusca]|uniref:Uncharacterized protein n=1 Tax=Allacma fusca TaxID=39272 RepID=A0A8J2JKJ7_9HEXA|nr:unnamed protein product [Allacma fusca]
MCCVAWKAVLFLIILTDFYNTWAEDDLIKIALGWRIETVTKILAGKFYNPNTYESSQQERIPCMVSKHPKLRSDDNNYNYGIIHLREPLIFNDVLVKELAITTGVHR